MCKLPLRLEVWGYTNSRSPARTNTLTLLQAGFVRGRAISNRLVFLLALGCSHPNWNGTDISPELKYPPGTPTANGVKA